MASVVSVKGQYVIPAKLRKKYHIDTGSKIEAIDTGKGIFLVPIQNDVISSLRGALKRTSTKSLLQFRKEDIRLEDKKFRRKKK